MEVNQEESKSAMNRLNKKDQKWNLEIHQRRLSILGRNQKKDYKRELAKNDQRGRNVKVIKRSHIGPNEAT